MSGKPIDVRVNWSGRAADPALRDGIYQVRMVAVASEAPPQRAQPLTGEEAEALSDCNSAGKTVSSVEILEGVPGRNGTVTQLSTGASTTITPASGQHFYYAKVTQSDGKILWSAPVRVTQSATSGDTVAPAVSASETGTGGTITLAATASDNVGVSKVEFYVDNVLKGSNTTSPYSMTLNSTTLSNGTHSLIAKAYDAAGNVGTSGAASFSISNASTGTQLLLNPGFESGAISWQGGSGIINNATTTPAHGGSWKAKLAGTGATRTDNLYQQVAIPRPPPARPCRSGCR